MIITVREYNAWENERWTYVFNLEKQSASALNYLMAFVRLANKEFDQIKQYAKNKPVPNYHPIFNRHSQTPFAASSYMVCFYDTVEHKKGGIRLVSEDSAMNLSDNSGYKPSANLMLDRKISIARMKSALIAMRERKHNKLYKNFESVFLKGKQAVTQ